MKSKIMILNNKKVKVSVPERDISTEEFLNKIGPILDKVIERMDRKWMK